MTSPILGDYPVSKTLFVAGTLGMVGGCGGYSVFYNKFTIDKAKIRFDPNSVKKYTKLYNRYMNETQASTKSYTIENLFTHTNEDKWDLVYLGERHPARELKNKLSNGQITLEEFKKRYADLPHPKILEEMKCHEVGIFLRKGARILNRCIAAAILGGVALTISGFIYLFEDIRKNR